MELGNLARDSSSASGCPWSTLCTTALSEAGYELLNSVLTCDPEQRPSAAWLAHFAETQLKNSEEGGGASAHGSDEASIPASPPNMQPAAPPWFQDPFPLALRP